MVRYFMILLFLTACLYVNSQSYTIEGTLIGRANEEVYFMDIKGEKRKIIDTVHTDLTGSFKIELKKDLAAGIYIIGTQDRQMIELIFNHENIQFVSSGDNSDRKVQIIHSVENIIYYDYLYAKGAAMYKLELLLPLIQYFPQDDPFYKTTLNRYFNIQEDLTERINTLTSNNPESLASRYITADAPLFVDPALGAEARNIYQKTHHFDRVNFSDTLLIRGTILTSKLVEYLSLYQFNSNSQEELEANLLKGVDTIMAKAFVNQSVYEFVIDFIIEGFNSIGFEKGLQHIASHSKLDQFCENTARKLELEKRIDIMNKLAIGKAAPDFEAADMKGNNFRLADIRSKRTLLVFWASWCTHCDNILPILQEIYKNTDRTKLEIVAISVDEDKAAYEEVVLNRQFDWINIAELKGWDGPIIMDYGVAATPSLFVLDENKTIIGKPVRMDDLEQLISE